MTRKLVSQSVLPAVVVFAVVALAMFLPPTRLGPFSLTCYSYAYQCGTPTVTHLNPNSDSTAGGITVTITGTNFNNSGLVVHFGATAGTGAHIVSDTQVTVVSPAHAAGTVDVTVTTTAGTSAISTADQFTFITPGTHCTSVTASASPASPQAVGTVVTLSAVASGCVSPQYQFWILPPGGSWTIVQAYSGTASFTWHTVGDPAATYLWTVWARALSSTNNLDVYFPADSYTLSPAACASVTASASPGTPQLSGTVVTLTAVASGCTNANPLFQFFILPPGGTWTIVQAFSASASFTWHTVHDPAATYLWTVWVKDASSTAKLDAYFPAVSYTLTTQPCTSVTATAAPPTTTTVGMTVTLTAVASGCPSPQYQFWILPPGGKWTIVQAYSGTATFTWTTTGDPKGTYYWTVWVRDNSSTASFDKYTVGATYTLT